MLIKTFYGSTSLEITDLSVERNIKIDQSLGGKNRFDLNSYGEKPIRF